MVDGIQYKLYLQGQQAIKRNLQRTTKRNGMTMTEASQLLGLSTPQQLNNKFNNKKVSLSDLKDFWV